MREIVHMVSASLDGFFEGPERRIDWHMAGVWPTIEADPDPDGATHVPLRLAETRAFGNGVVLLRHRRLTRHHP